MSSPAGALPDLRYDFEDYRLTPQEHKKLWKSRIRAAQEALEEAIRVAPPWEQTRVVEIRPGDPRYAHAPIGVTWVTHRIDIPLTSTKDNGK